MWIKSIPIPDFDSFNERKIVQSTKIYDRTEKNILYDVHENIKRTIIPYEDIPRHIKNATVAIEDTEFYQHKGISPIGILRAFFTNLTEGKIKGQGGSTITQQLVKNSLLTFEKTFTRKIKEVILSLKLEKAFSKEEILTLYLNEIPYGGTNYGIEAASQSFFEKGAKDLTLAESAYLAAIPQRPTYYSPYGTHTNELTDRKNLVLDRMFELGFIEESEYEEAKKEQVIFIGRGELGIQAPHFVMYIKNYLEEKYGKENVEQGGLRVITTLDLELQIEAEKIVKQYAEENEKKFNAFNAGMIGTDPKTGQILVMVGSRDWHGDPLPENCTPGVDCRFEPKLNTTVYGNGRQPGSAFKPFVYATAFKQGYEPETVLFDLKTEFNSSCNPDGTPKTEIGTQEDECYMPGNYDNIFRGPVSLREALAQSINIPAVKVLYLTGIKDAIETAQSMGITTLADSLRYGLTLVLGGGEVRLLEMTGAYSVFANDGVKNPLTAVLRIEDSKGNVLEKFEQQEQRVLESNVARKINNVLSDNTARAPAFGERSWLYFPDREVAVKTGTTNDYRDAWIVGYTPNFALGTWVGNNDNTSMEKRVAGFIVAPMWNAFFNKVFEKLPKEDFPSTENNFILNSKPILRGEWRVTEPMATSSETHCILHWVDKNDPQGTIPENPQKDPQYLLWEIPVQLWKIQQGI